VVTAAVALSGVAADSFTDTVQEAFKASALTGFTSSSFTASMAIGTFTDTSRRSSTLDVSFTVYTGSTDSSAVDSSISGFTDYLTDGSFLSTLQQNVAAAGVSAFDVTYMTWSTTPAVDRGLSTAPTSTSLSSTVVIVIVVLGGVVVLLGVGLTAYCTCLSRPREPKTKGGLEFKFEGEDGYSSGLHRSTGKAEYAHRSAIVGSLSSPSRRWREGNPTEIELNDARSGSAIRK